MPAYWLARCRIDDPVNTSSSTDLVPAHHREIRRQSARPRRALQDRRRPGKFSRHVVIEFPSLEQAAACHASPEYQAAAAFRRNGGGVVEQVIVESGDATR